MYKNAISQYFSYKILNSWVSYGWSSSELVSTNLWCASFYPVLFYIIVEISWYCSAFLDISNSCTHVLGVILNKIWWWDLGNVKSTLPFLSSQGLIDESNRFVWKLFLLDRNMWNHTTVGKLFVLYKNTWYHITGLQTNDYRWVKKNVIFFFPPFKWLQWNIENRNSYDY